MEAVLGVTRGLSVLALFAWVLVACAQPEPTPPATLAVTATPVPSGGPAIAPTLEPLPTPRPTATPSPARPAVRKPDKAAAYRPAWGEPDLRGLDPWGDAGDDTVDLTAVYHRQEGGLLRFRADFLDLRAGKVPELYLALDLAPGGATHLEPGGAKSADLAWDILVKVTGGDTAQVLAADYRPVSGAAVVFKTDPTLDYVTIDLQQDTLPVRVSAPFQFQALAVASGGTELADKTRPISSNSVEAGRAKLVFRFGNLEGPGTPHGVTSWYDSVETDRDGKMKPSGWRYLLDGMEKYWIPMALTEKQINYLGWTEDVGLYDRLRALHEAGLLDMPDTLAYGHFMPWQPQDVDAKAIALSRQLVQQIGLPPSTTFNPYEGQATVADLQTIKETGYESVIIGGEQEYYKMFGPSGGEPVHAAGKLHRANGINLVFQRFPFSFVWDPRWGDDPYKDWSESEMWRGSDGGLHVWFRRNLLDLALDPDQEQFTMLGTDIHVTPWGFQEVVEANLRWIAEHPWIEVIRHDELFHQGWKVMDHGDLGLPPDTLFFRFQMEGDGHYNAYFPQFYYGGIADGHSPFVAKGQRIESYADYVPYWRDGLPIPSGRKMGDDRTPGTIIYETLNNLRSAPDNGLTTLAWLSYFTSIGEQTFHSVKDHTPHDPDMEKGDVPYGGAYLHPAAKMRANNLRQVNKIIAAARWADSAGQGNVPARPAVEVADLDLDGEDEYVLRSDRLFLVFEDDGGCLEYGFAYVPGRGPVQFVAPVYQFTADIFWGPSQWDWTKGEGGQVSYSPAWVGAFLEQLMDNTSLAHDKYGVVLGEASIAFTSPDGKVRKTFSLDEKGQAVLVQYETAQETVVETHVALDPLRMWSRSWSQGMAEVETPTSLGLRYPDGLTATLTLEKGARWYSSEVTSFLDSPARWEWRHDPSRTDYPSGHWFPYPFAEMMVSGQGKFTVRLDVGP